MKISKKHFVIASLLVLIICQSAFSQGDTMDNDLLYIADYNISWQHIPEWTEMHHEHIVPILNELVDEGIITGWSAWQHHTGGEFNWKMIFRAPEWDDFDVFWEEYFGRISEDVSDRAMPMIDMHRDQIWELSELRMSESAGPVTYAYEAMYQVNFNDLDDWNRDWSENMVPVLEQVMEEGKLAGWAVVDHNTGARYNKIQVMFFDDWDHIDDVLGSMMGSLFEDPDRWEQVGGMVQGHNDEIWNQVTSPQNEN